MASVKECLHLKNAIELMTIEGGVDNRDRIFYADLLSAIYNFINNISDPMERTEIKLRTIAASNKEDKIFREFYLQFKQMYANIQATRCALQNIFIDMVVKRRIEALDARHNVIDFSTILHTPVLKIDAICALNCLCVSIAESLQELLQKVSKTYQKLMSALSVLEKSNMEFVEVADVYKMFEANIQLLCILFCAIKPKSIDADL